jgi:single-strand DNA-binding protein
MNRIILRGNLTEDPTFKQVGANNTELCKFRLGVNQVSGNTIFIDVDAWGKTAVNCNKYLKKGREVLVDGKLGYDVFTTKDGAKGSKYYVVADNVEFLSKPEGQDNSTTAEGSNSSSQNTTETDDIPF